MTMVRLISCFLCHAADPGFPVASNHVTLPCGGNATGCNLLQVAWGRHSFAVLWGGGPCQPCALDCLLVVEYFCLWSFRGWGLPLFPYFRRQS